MNATSESLDGPTASRASALKIGAAFGAVGFAVGVMAGLWVSRAAIADECESTGRVSSGDKVFACTDGRAVKPGWR